MYSLTFVENFQIWKLRIFANFLCLKKSDSGFIFDKYQVCKPEANACDNTPNNIMTISPIFFLRNFC